MTILVTLTEVGVGGHQRYLGWLTGSTAVTWNRSHVTHVTQVSSRDRSDLEPATGPHVTQVSSRDSRAEDSSLAPDFITN